MNWFLAIFGLLLALALAPLILPDPSYPTDVEELPKSVRKWYERGEYFKVSGYKIFYVHEQYQGNEENPPTFVILHGFPSSSYEYHKVFDCLLERGNVFVHDQIGFGFSDKPDVNFTYSIAEAADYSLIIWRAMGLDNVHVVAHDMGDTVLTEILARRHRELLPCYFDDFFTSVTFTNGGMKYSAINFRLGQTLLSNVYLGSYFSVFANRLYIAKMLTKKQLTSIWGPNANETERERDIEAITSLYEFNGGFLISHKTIYYLWDRAHFEFRWFGALSQLNIPTRFIWGDSDAVSPVEIPQFLKYLLSSAGLIFIEGAGHFIMLEQPKKWVELVAGTKTGWGDFIPFL